MKCRFPIIDLEGFSIAVLLSESSTSQHIGLLLHRAPETQVQDFLRPKYYASYAFIRNDIGRPVACRLVHLGNDLHNLQFRGQTVQAEWREIYVYPFPEQTSTSRNLAPAFLFSELDTFMGVPFRVPRWQLSAFVALDLQPRVADTRRHGQRDMERVHICFTSTRKGEEISINLGLCRQTPHAHERPVHWASAEIFHKGTWGEEQRRRRKASWERAHDCAQDHVSAWPNGEREFSDEDGARIVRLAFRPCRHTPETTLVMLAELRGEAYEEMQRVAGSTFPTLAAARAQDASTELQGRGSGFPLSRVQLGTDAQNAGPTPRDIAQMAARMAEMLLRLQRELAKHLPPLGQDAAHGLDGSESQGWSNTLEQLPAQPRTGSSLPMEEQRAMEGADDVSSPDVSNDIRG